MEMGAKSADKTDLGLVHCYTGGGPGKTRSALGLAMRALGHGYEVHVIQFMKGRWRGKDEFGELKTAKKLEGLQINRFGSGKLIEKQEDISDLDKKLALEGLRRAKELLSSKEPMLVILDEVNVALHFRLLKLDDVLTLIEDKPDGVELVLTGRKAPEEIKERSDYLVVFNPLKHPYSKGVQARKGIEY